MRDSSHEVLGDFPRGRRAFNGRQNKMGPGWDKKRAQQLRRESICQWTESGVRCPEFATIADHIIPRFEGGTDDPSNLQSLCKKHSDTKTAHEGHRAWAAHKATVKSRFDRTEKHPGEL